MTNPIADPLVENLDTDAVSPLVRLEATPEGIATVTIDRPTRRNAFDAETIAALRQTFETVQAADHLRAVFLRGAEGVFCAGADIDWMRAAAEWDEDDNRDDAMALAEMLKALHDLPVLTVALVEGPAYGGGVGLAAACDMAVATADARFALSEVRLGLVAATISPYVVQAIGPRAARALMATGRPFGAEEAHRIGLVDEVVADAAALEAAAARIGTDMLLCGREAVAQSKRLVAEVAGRKLDHGLMAETARVIASVRATDEAREGVAAFLQKRRPDWAG